MLWMLDLYPVRVPGIGQVRVVPSNGPFFSTGSRYIWVMRQAIAEVSAPTVKVPMIDKPSVLESRN